MACFFPSQLMMLTNKQTVKQNFIKQHSLYFGGTVWVYRHGKGQGTAPSHQWNASAVWLHRRRDPSEICCSQKNKQASSEGKIPTGINYLSPIKFRGLFFAALSWTHASIQQIMNNNNCLFAHNVKTTRPTSLHEVWESIHFFGVACYNQGW